MPACTGVPCPPGGKWGECHSTLDMHAWTAPGGRHPFHAHTHQETKPKMSRNPSSIEFLHRPADLFQHLRSPHIQIKERIQSAQQHYAHQNFSLPSKQLYFLRWIFQVEFFEPNRSSKSSKTEPYVPSSNKYLKVDTILMVLIVLRR